MQEKKNKNNCSLDSNGIRKFTTCEEYEEYMQGDYDEHSSEKVNPVPEDAMLLSELKTKSEAEILGIANYIGSLQNKSDIRRLYAAGYGFSWSDIEVVARYHGFSRDDLSGRKVRFSAKDIEEIKPAKREYSDLFQEACDVKQRKVPYKRMAIFAFEEDITRFKESIKEDFCFGLREQGQAVMFRQMLDRTGK